jgi:hypothetical protein
MPGTLSPPRWLWRQDRWCFGKTPLQTFLDAIPIAREKMIAAKLCHRPCQNSFREAGIMKTGEFSTAFLGKIAPAPTPY